MGLNYDRMRHTYSHPLLLTSKNVLLANVGTDGRTALKRTEGVADGRSDGRAAPKHSDGRLKNRYVLTRWNGLMGTYTQLNKKRPQMAFLEPSGRCLKPACVLLKS